MHPADEASDRWVDLNEAARRVQLPYQDVVAAVARFELAATTAHPARMGTWMVRLPVLKAWARKRGLP